VVKNRFKWVLDLNQIAYFMKFFGIFINCILCKEYESAWEAETTLLNDLFHFYNPVCNLDLFRNNN
jgi:hypothetical protein